MQENINKKLKNIFDEFNEYMKHKEDFEYIVNPVEEGDKELVFAFKLKKDSDISRSEKEKMKSTINPDRMTFGDCKEHDYVFFIFENKKLQISID